MTAQTTVVGVMGFVTALLPTVTIKTIYVMVDYDVITSGRITMVSTKSILRKAKEILNELNPDGKDVIEMEISQGINEVEPVDGYKQYEADPSRRSIVILINGGSGEESLNRTRPSICPFRAIRSARIPNERKEYGSILNNEPSKP